MCLPGSGEGPCVEWPGSHYSFGHGRVELGRGRSVGAHRIVYAIALDISLDDLAGVVIRHTCDNPPCVSPAHLQSGTQRDNVQDMIDRGRASHGERHGMARLTAEQVRDIRRRHVPGVNRWHRGNTAELCAEFGISDSQLGAIVHGQRWASC